MNYYEYIKTKTTVAPLNMYDKQLSYISEIREHLTKINIESWDNNILLQIDYFLDTKQFNEVISIICQEEARLLEEQRKEEARRLEEQRKEEVRRLEEQRKEEKRRLDIERVNNELGKLYRDPELKKYPNIYNAAENAIKKHSFDEARIIIEKHKKYAERLANLINETNKIANNTQQDTTAMNILNWYCGVPELSETRTTINNIDLNQFQESYDKIIHCEKQLARIKNKKDIYTQSALLLIIITAYYTFPTIVLSTFFYHNSLWWLILALPILWGILKVVSSFINDYKQMPEPSIIISLISWVLLYNDKTIIGIAFLILSILISHCVIWGNKKEYIHMRYI